MWTPSRFFRIQMQDYFKLYRKEVNLNISQGTWLLWRPNWLASGINHPRCVFSLWARGSAENFWFPKEGFPPTPTSLTHTHTHAQSLPPGIFWVSQNSGSGSQLPGLDPPPRGGYRLGPTFEGPLLPSTNWPKKLLTHFLFPQSDRLRGQFVTYINKQ